MWNKFSEIKKKAVEGLNTATSVATQLAKDIIKDNVEQDGDDAEVDGQEEVSQGTGKIKTGNEQKNNSVVKEAEPIVVQKGENDPEITKEREKIGTTDEVESPDHENVQDKEHTEANIENFNVNKIVEEEINDRVYLEQQGSTVKDESEKAIANELSEEQPSLAKESKNEKQESKKENEIKMSNNTEPVQEGTSDNEKMIPEEKDIENNLLDQKEKTNLVLSQIENNLETDVAANNSAVKEKIEKEDAQEASAKSKASTEADNKTKQAVKPVTIEESNPIIESMSNQPSNKSIPIEAPKSNASKTGSPVPSPTRTSERRVEDTQASPGPKVLVQANHSGQESPLLKPQCTEHLKQIEKLSKEKKDMISDITTLTTQLVTTKTENSEAQSKLKSFESHVQALSTQLADLKKQHTTTVNKKDKEIGLLGDEAKLYKERIKTLQAWCDEVAKKDREKDADRAKKERETGDKVKLEKDKWQREAEGLSQALADARVATSKVEAEKSTVQSELLKAREAMERLQEIVENNEDEKSSLEDELRKSRKVNEELKLERERTVKQITLLNDEVKRSKEEVARANFAMQEREKEFIGVAEEREKLKKEAAELIEKIKEEQKVSQVDNDHLVGMSDSD